MRTFDPLVEQRFHSRSHYNDGSGGNSSSSHDSDSEFSSTSNSPSASFAEAHYESTANNNNNYTISNKSHAVNRRSSAVSVPQTDHNNTIVNNYYNHTYSASGSAFNMSDGNISFADKRLINFISSEESTSALDRLYLSFWSSVLSLLATFVILGGMLVLVAIPPLYMSSKAGKVSYIAVMIPVLAIAGTLINYVIVEHPQLLLTHFMLRLARDANKYRVALEGHSEELNELVQKSNVAMSKDKNQLTHETNEAGSNVQINPQAHGRSSSSSTFIALQEMIVSVQRDGRALMRCVQDEVNWAHAQITQLEQICHAPLHPTVQREERSLKSFLLTFGKLQDALLQAFKEYNEHEHLINAYYVHYHCNTSSAMHKPLPCITSSFAESPSAHLVQGVNNFTCNATPHDINITNTSREVTSQITTNGSPAEENIHNTNNKINMSNNKNNNNNNELNGRVSRIEKNAIHLPLTFQHSHGMVDLLDESLRSEQTPRSLYNDEHDSEFDYEVSNTHDHNYSHVDVEERKLQKSTFHNTQNTENKDGTHHHKTISTKNMSNNTKNSRHYKDYDSKHHSNKVNYSNINNKNLERHESLTEELELQTASEFTIGGYSTAGLATSMELTSPSSRVHQQRRLDANFTFPEKINSNDNKEEEKQIVQRKLELSRLPSSSVYENSSSPKQTPKLPDSNKSEKNTNKIENVKVDEVKWITTNHKLIIGATSAVPFTPVIRLARGHRFYSDNAHVFFYVVIKSINEFTKEKETELNDNKSNPKNNSSSSPIDCVNNAREVFTFESHLRKVNKAVNSNTNILHKDSTSSVEYVFVLSNEKLPFQSFRVDLHERSKHSTMSTLQRRLVSFLHCAEEVESEIEWEEEQESKIAKRTRLDLSSLAYAANNSNNMESHNNISSTKEKKEEETKKIKSQHDVINEEADSHTSIVDNNSSNNKTVNYINHIKSSSNQDSSIHNSNDSKNTKLNSRSGEIVKELYSSEEELPSRNSHRRCETMTEVFHDDNAQDGSINNNNSSSISSSNNIHNGQTNLYKCDKFTKDNTNEEVKHNHLNNHSVSGNASMTSNDSCIIHDNSSSNNSHTEVDATEIENSYYVASVSTAVANTNALQSNNNENNKPQNSTSNNTNNDNSSSYKTEAAIILPSSHHLRECGSYIMSWRAWPSKAMRLTYLEVELDSKEYEDIKPDSNNNHNKSSNQVLMKSEYNTLKREVENEGHNVSNMEDANSVTIPHHVDPNSSSTLTSSPKSVITRNATNNNKRCTVPVLEGVLNGVLCVITHASIIVSSDANSKIVAVEFHGLCIEDERNSRNISEHSQRENTNKNDNINGNSSQKERHVYEFGDVVVERKTRKQNIVLS